MVKKLLLISALIAGPTAVTASTAPYVGASIGITANTSTSAANAQIGSQIFSQPANFRGVPFSAFAGYGGIVNQNFYLAGEVTGTVGTAEISNANGLKTSYGYGASVLPGVLLSDFTMAYGRLGVVYTRFSDADQTVTGGQFGVGLQTTLTQNVDVRGEYNFTAYRSFNNDLGRVSAPRSDAVNLGLVYKFD